MRRKGTHRAAVVLAWLIALGAGGCAVRQAPRPPEPPAAARGRFIKMEVPGPDFDLTDPESIEQRVALAVVLTDRGRFADAARYFRQLAAGQVNQFGERLLRAAAVSYLQADDRRNFLAVMADLRGRLGAERLAVAPPAVEVLVALEAHYAGHQVTPPRVLEPIMPSSNLEE